VIDVKYEKPQVVRLPEALESILASSLMKGDHHSDGPGSSQITVAAYSSDED
jgi:hypothetical protein